MSRTAPLELCARCEMFKPSAEMTNVYALNASGQTVILRLCRTCANPVLTYIASRVPRLVSIDTGQVLLASLALIAVILNVMFGLVIGGARGFAVTLTGMMLGAGIVTVLAVDMR